MIEIVKIIILAILSVLPDSPFSAYFAEMDTSFYSYFNWIFPLDACLDILFVWVLCIPYIVIFLFIWDFVKDTLLVLLKKAIMLLFFA